MSNKKKKTFTYDECRQNEIIHIGENKTEKEKHAEYPHLRHKFKKGSICFDICGSISAGKTSFLSKFEQYINNEINREEIKKNYQNLTQFIGKFNVFYEKLDSDVIQRYYSGFSKKKTPCYIYFLIVLIILALIEILILIIEVINDQLIFKVFNILIFILLVVIALLFAYFYRFYKINTLTRLDVCFDTQMYFLSKRKASCRYALNYEGLIGTDRSWIEDQIFPLMQTMNNEISDYQYMIYKTFFTEYSYEMPFPNFWIYLKSTPETTYSNLQERIKSLKDEGKDTSGEELISFKYLKDLINSYNNWEEKMIEDYKERFIVVDYTNFLPFAEMVKLINDSIGKFNKPI